MKILFIGFTNPNHAASFIAQGFRDLGHEVTHIGTEDLIFIDGNPKLSEFYTDEDFVYIYHINLKFLENDLPPHIPVVFYAFEMLWRTCVDKCDILIMSTPIIENYYVYYYPHILMNNPEKYIQYYGVDLQRFDATGKKKYLECSFMGKTEWTAKCWVEEGMYKTRKRVVEACEDYLDRMPHDDYEEYISHLKHSQSTLIVHGRSCYISQRIYEAAAASVCPIIWVDDEIGLAIYTEIGLVSGENCIFIGNTEYIEEYLKHSDLIKIGQQARKWVEARNNINNCKEIINYVETYNKHVEKRKEQRSLRATRNIESQL